MTTMTKMYFSREDRIGDIYSDDDRVQCKDPTEDWDRTNDAADDLFDSAGSLIENMDLYFCSVLSVETTPEIITEKRRRLVTEWAKAQEALSRLAWILRIDGNDAFQRVVDAKKANVEPDMSGL